jgi:hypothetical protein
MQRPAGSQPWTIPDVRDPTTTYVFNIGADTPTPPSSFCAGKSPTGCFQVETRYSTCYAVGGPSALGWNFSLYDSTKPARGVSLTMLNGDSQWCPNRANRTFTVSLLCAPMPTTTFNTSATVFELNTCDYRMEIKSVAGCPTECTGGPSSQSVCGGNGVCGFDTDANRAKCYCYAGYAGSSCAPAGAAAAGLSAEGVILIVVCIVLAMVIGLVGFMFLKLRKLQVDPSAYEQMQGRFNELGMLAV